MTTLPSSVARFADCRLLEADEWCPLLELGRPRVVASNYSLAIARVGIAWTKRRRQTHTETKPEEH